jgi:hypothetical protein
MSENFYVRSDGALIADRDQPRKPKVDARPGAEVRVSAYPGSSPSKLTKGDVSADSTNESR